MPTQAYKKRKKEQSRARTRRPNPPELVERSAAISPPVVSEGFQRRTQIEVTVCVLLAVVTFAVYSRALRNPFVNYDDQGYVVENAQVQQGLSEATLRWALTSTDATNWHPLTWMSHALDCQLFGLDATGHHLTSVLLHVMNTLLLFLLLARATGAIGRSALVAGLFALHPVNVESVAWIAERKNVLCMLFMLLTIGAYGWYARKPKIGRYLVVAVLFVLALAAKPMAVTLPFALLLLDFWPLQRVASLPASGTFQAPQSQFWRLAAEKFPLVILSVASSVVTLVAQRAAVQTNESVPFLIRFVNASYAYSMYIVKAFWPARLASFYPYEGYRLSGWEFLLCVLFLTGVSVWALRKRSHLYLAVGWFWFLGTLVPMIGLVQVGDQAMADRYAYLSLIGVFTGLVWGIAEWAQSRKLNLRWLGAAAALILVAFSLLTWRQIGIWHSSRDLWFHALEATEDNYMAEDYAGSALLTENFEATGQRHLDEAMQHFKNAVRINPNDAISHLNLGADMHERGQLQEAIEQYQIVLTLTRDSHLMAKSFIDLGAAYQQLGDYDTAEKYYRTAQALEPNSDVIFLNLGKLAMVKRIRDLSESTAAKPSPQAYLDLGQLQQAAGQTPEARQSYEAALKLNPKSAGAQQALSSLDKAAK